MSLLDRGRRGECLDDLGIVDIHGHLGRTDFCIPDRSARSLVDVMDRLGVRSAVCSSMECFGTAPEAGNREVLEAVRAFPGRILGYVVLWPSDATENAAEARRYVDEGFVGVKLHNTTGFDYTDEAFTGALSLANERRLVVLLHTWGREAELDQVRRLAERYREASFVLGHSGVSREEVYTALACDCGNVYLDLCMSTPGRGLVERLVEGAGADRVVWGSDGVFLNMAHQLGKVLGARLSDEVKEQILSANAQRLLDRIQR